MNKKLSEKEIINILENKSINKCSKSQRMQVLSYAFGRDFINSNNKGNLKEYNKKGISNEVN